MNFVDVAFPERPAAAAEGDSGLAPRPRENPMFPEFRFDFSPVARIGGVAAILAGLTTAAIAQSYECEQLKARIASVNPGMNPQAGRYLAAAQKQQYELDRTASYARSIGCENRQFLMFGKAPPPQCGGLDSQMGRMRANLASLRDQARGGGGDARRAALQSRYDSTCRGRGLFDSLFGDRQQVPVQDPEQPAYPDDQKSRGPLAVCVRTCDGGYFPVSYSARRARLDVLEELCKAQCPGVDAALYTMPASGNIEDAVSTEGDAYTALPNAGKYRRKFDPTCACKPADKSWSEALQQAEQLMGRKARRDVIVTPEQSAQMSRPKEPPAGAPPGPAVTGAEPPAVAQPIVIYRLKDGETEEKTDKAGAKRRVRVIGPKL